MNRLDVPPLEETEAKDGAAKDGAATAEAKTEAAKSADDGYVPVTGRSRKDVEHMRECEALVSAKTASDYEHVVLAYGVLWALFAAYGMFLWRRSAQLRQDLEDVRRQVGRSGS